MDQNKLAGLVATILVVLARGGETGEGVVYARVMAHCNLDEFQTVLGIMAQSGLVVRGRGFAVKITGRGRETAAKIEKALAANLAAKG